MNRALACVALLLCSGCGAAASVAPRPAPTPLEVAGDRVGRAVDRGLADSDRVTWFLTDIRYLPADCDCPPWEVRLRGRWERVGLEPSRGAPDDVSLALAAPVAGATLPDARVTRTSGVLVAGDGWRYAVFAVEGFGPRPVDDDQSQSRGADAPAGASPIILSDAGAQCSGCIDSTPR